MKTAGEILQFTLLSLITGLVLEIIFKFSLSLFLVAVGASIVYTLVRVQFKKKYGALTGRNFTVVIGVALGIIVSLNVLIPMFQS
ncbi:hypothetical protein [Guptibacillus hwajinpoensis]|uniref:hypothetical protein n=1 Tax=Guptibacillus hwajinpoensis TaxID=208199 RepID=UPI001CFEBECA|nr:hypothetical protein [Pseudalkalibacillus hwajinpoensis]WLR59049.1 hypothetical protein LC071_18145 [Pseudalkalibacillus hwajinpoensis]